VVCLALVAHELVVLFVHSPGQLDTWLVARCMKGEWEWQRWKWESRHEQVANRGSSGCAVLMLPWRVSGEGQVKVTHAGFLPRLLLELFRTAGSSPLLSTNYLDITFPSSLPCAYSLLLMKTLKSIQSASATAALHSSTDGTLETAVIFTNHLDFSFSTITCFTTNGNTQGIRA
jgi:hypothetical protein